MGNTGHVKYYDGFTVEGGKEVTADRARKLLTYAKAYFGGDGRPERAELYSSGEMFMVIYFDGRNAATIKSSHRATYGSVRFSIRTAKTQIRSFTWLHVLLYSKAGELEGFSLRLQDTGGRDWMEVRKDANGGLSRVTKGYWSGPDELRYIFEYNRAGHLISVQDTVDGDEVSFDDVKSDLPDPKFFESGLALPRELAGTSIPHD
jgi:hypothetical protein